MPLTPDESEFLDQELPRLVDLFLAESPYVVGDRAKGWIREYAANREPELAFEAIAYELDDDAVLVPGSRLEVLATDLRLSDLLDRLRTKRGAVKPRDIHQR